MDAACVWDQRCLYWQEFVFNFVVFLKGVFREEGTDCGLGA